MLVDTSSAIARSVNGMVWCRSFSMTNAMGIVCQPETSQAYVETAIFGENIFEACDPHQKIYHADMG